MSATVLDNIKRTTQATLDALNAWDYDALVAVRTEDFVFQGLPDSLNIPALNNEQYHGLWHNVLTSALPGLRIEARTRVHDAESRKAVVHGSSRTQTADGVVDRWELIMMMSFNETGEKLVRLEEFFDTKHYLGVMERAGQGAGEKGGA